MQGSNDMKILGVVEATMSQITGKIKDRKEPRLTTGQYNAVYEAVQKTLEFLIV